ncbi:unnamed protein product [Lupinus luteus]|uniref:Protein TAR1 n=2 Tax=Lupinus luteus TaxID=3873 RepID=A0AAV1YR71_LUPLU
MCKCRSHGTFPLFGLQSSHLNICYYHQDLHRRPLRPGSRPRFCSDRRALLLIGAWPLPRRPDERFARQYRCGPPPEFPLASPRSGIVHHLSGPDRYALTRTLHRRSGSVGGATHKGIPPISFLAPYGFTCPLTRTHVRLLGPCFKTGRMGSPQADARSTQVPKHTETARASNHNRDDDVSTSMSTARAWATITIRVGPARVDWRTGSRRSTSDRGTSPAPIRFPPDNFKHSLTLFSKSFSSFPRGTCSLSVSRQYLALDGIYRPIGAAFPNNPTRRQRLVVRQGPGTTGLSPSPAPPSRGLGPGPPLRTLLQTTIRTPRATDSHGGLFPVRSPLLRESLLVSFPPLIDMLKLSGHHPSRPPPPRTQFSTNRETLLPGSQHSPRFVPGTWPRHGGNDVQHPGRRALGLMASGATCVQRLDGSRDSAIHTKYRISLRSSSMQEPRYPLPRVFRISVSQRRPHEHRLRAGGGELNDFNFLGAFGAGVLLLGQEDTAEGGAPPDTRGAEVPNTSSHP